MKKIRLIMAVPFIALLTLIGAFLSAVIRIISGEFPVEAEFQLKHLYSDKKQ